VAEVDPCAAPLDQPVERRLAIQVDDAEAELLPIELGGACHVGDERLSAAIA
jgi:hypothetical protein